MKNSTIAKLLNFFGTITICAGLFGGFIIYSRISELVPDFSILIVGTIIVSTFTSGLTAIAISRILNNSSKSDY